MLEDFPLEILQCLICLVGSMETHVVMQEQQLFDKGTEKLKILSTPIKCTHP
jgi:hypothetical protein